MKSYLFVLILLLTTIQVSYSQWSNTSDNTSTGSLSVGSSVDNSYSSFTLIGPNVPLGVNSKRDIVFNFLAAGKSYIRSYRGGSWDTYLQFLTTASDNTNGVRLHIDGVGNVGIGTTTPSSMLTIKGDYGLKLEPAAGNTVDFYITSNSANNMIGVNARTKYGAWEIPDTSKPSSFLDFSTYSNNNPYYGGMAFFTRSANASGIGTEKMVILNNGYVGIGTTSPQSTLDVRGNIVIENGTDPILYTGVGTTELNRYLSLINSTGLHNASGLKAGGILIADSYVYANPGKNDLIVKGNVGIGTPSPDYPLTVKGSIHAKEVRVDLTGALSVPDYVFEKDYKLASLEEIKTYIDQNKHLPEVPSAKEIEKNGVQLGEMNMILLKKIEELTLYVIEQNKMIEEMIKEINDLKAKR